MTHDPREGAFPVLKVQGYIHQCVSHSLKLKSSKYFMFITICLGILDQLKNYSIKMRFNTTVYLLICAFSSNIDFSGSGAMLPYVSLFSWCF